MSPSACYRLKQDEPLPRGFAFGDVVDAAERRHELRSFIKLPVCVENLFLGLDEPKRKLAQPRRTVM